MCSVKTHTYGKIALIKQDLQLPLSESKSSGNRIICLRKPAEPGPSSAMMLRLTTLVAVVAQCSAQTVCLFWGGSEGGHTEMVADYIAEKTGMQPIPIGLVIEHEAGPDLFKSCDHYVIGAPTMNAEAEKGRTGTAWDPFIQDHLPKMGSLKGKTFAVFGLGDQSKYPWHFCDAMDEMARAFLDAGGRLLGAWVQQEDEDGLPSYYYEGSKAAWEGPPLFGKFVGLALDDANQRTKTGERVREWLDQLRFEGMPIGTAKCDDKEGRRSRNLQAMATTEAGWYSAWGERLGCWWRGLPLPSQSQFGACMGALGLHVGSRFDSAFGGTRATPVTAGSRESQCDWIKEGAPQMQNFPELPFKGDFEFRLPPIPRLMPNGAFQSLMSYYEAPRGHYAARARTTASFGQMLAGGLAGSAAAAVVLVGGRHLLGRNGRLSTR